MKILHTVEFYHPSRGGAQEVVRQISERLVERGHDVTVATTRIAARPASEHNGVKIKEFAISGNAVRGYKGNTVEYQRFLNTARPDVMMNYAAQQWTADLAFPLLNSLPYARVLAPCGFSGLRRKDYTHYFSELPAVLRAYDLLLLHSGTYQDAGFIAEAGIKNTVIVPNGAALEEFAMAGRDFRGRYGIPADGQLLVTLGTHTGLKGHREFLRLLSSSRLNNVTGVVIGNHDLANSCYLECTLRARLVRLLGRGRRNAIVLDLPREEVVAALQEADLFVFPSNVECSPLVLFESLAAGTPFVSSDCGNAREIAAWTGGGIVVKSRRGRHDLVRVSQRELANQVKRLLSDPPFLKALGGHGQQAIEKRFNWHSITLEYENAYERAIEVRGQHGS